MGKGGLFSVSAPPEEEDEPSLDDFSDDLAMPAAEEEDEGIGAGPFDAYAETAFDTEADPAARSDALRQAILTVLEESGQKG